jgi:hypothetical protein
MKNWLLFLLFSLGLVGSASLVGCGYDPTGAVSQIRLSIYKTDCVDVLDASTANGAQLQIYPCGPGKRSQEWEVEPVNEGRNFMFINANSLMCMSVASGPDSSDVAPGQYVLQVTCDQTDPDQIWSIKAAPSGESGDNIVSTASGQCLDLPYGAIASIFTLQQYYCDKNDPAQGWNINPVGKGSTP